MSDNVRERAAEEIQDEDARAARRRLAERANDIESRERYARIQADAAAREERERTLLKRRELLTSLRYQRDANEPRLIRLAQAELDTARRNLADAERKLAELVDRHESTCRAIDRLEVAP